MGPIAVCSPVVAPLAPLSQGNGMQGPCTVARAGLSRVDQGSTLGMRNALASAQLPSGPIASTSSLYVYVLSPPICESQYVVGSVKNSPCLQRGRSASSLTLMPRPGPVGTGM